jgi:hypothetical protein
MSEDNTRNQLWEFFENSINTLKDKNVPTTMATLPSNNNNSVTILPKSISETPSQQTNEMDLQPCPPIQHNTEYSSILAKVSDTYMPKNLTWKSEYKPKDINKFQGNTDITFALVVRLSPKKHERVTFHECRTLTLLLLSMQNVLPYIKIVPFDSQRTEISDITSLEDIKFDETFCSHYIEDPTVTYNNNYICRIHFVAKKPFFWFKRNIHFQQWLKQESIRLEENNTPTIHCPKVGFLIKGHPRESLIKVYEARIKQLFRNKKIPPFYCVIEHVSVRQATTKVIVI